MQYSNVFTCFFSCESDHQLSTYTTGGGWGVIWNAYSCVQEEGVSRLVCTYTLTLFSCFGSIFVLSCLCFIYKNLTLTSSKKYVRHKRLHFSNKINFFRHEIRFFCKTTIYSLCFLLKPWPWNIGIVKHEIITKNLTDELPHKFPDNLRLQKDLNLRFKILRNEET